MEFDPVADGAGSFNDAIAALRERHLAGEAIQATGYFARPRVEIVPLTPELLGRLPPPSFADPGYAEALSADPGLSWAMREGVRIVMAAGVVPVWKGRGLAWLTHDGAEWRHWLAAARWARHWFAILPFRRIEATVLGGFDPGERWVEFLGFGHEGVMTAFGEDGADYHLYARIRP
ncbi:MAG: hypothetical protein AB7H90_02920 [Alphaproteobacteria bacterium]